MAKVYYVVENGPDYSQVSFYKTEKEALEFGLSKIPNFEMGEEPMNDEENDGDDFFHGDELTFNKGILYTVESGEVTIEAMDEDDAREQVQQNEDAVAIFFDGFQKGMYGYQGRGADGKGYKWDWDGSDINESNASSTNRKMKHIKLFEQFVKEAKMDLFPGYNNGLEANEYEKQLRKALSSAKGVEFNMSSTSMIYLKTEPNMADVDLTKDIQKALKGFDDNLDLDNITNNIGKPGQISPNDQQKGIVSYTIPKKVDWWTLKRAAGKDKPSAETVLNPEIIDSILDRMAQVSTTQDQLANIMWTSLEDLLRAAEDHMSSTNYKKFYKEIKKKYPKMA